MSLSDLARRDQATVPAGPSDWQQALGVALSAAQSYADRRRLVESAITAAATLAGAPAWLAAALAAEAVERLDDAAAPYVEAPGAVVVGVRVE